MRLIIISLLILISYTTQALSIDNLTAADEIWLNENNIMYISFVCDPSSNVSATITGNSYQKQLNSFIENSGIYSIAQSLDDIAESNNPYMLTVYCEKDNVSISSAKSFYVNKLASSAEIII